MPEFVRSDRILFYAFFAFLLLFFLLFFCVYTYYILRVRY